MPPKGRKAAAGDAAPAKAAATRSTRGKRAAEPAAEEPAAQPKPKRGTKKAAQEEMLEEPEPSNAPVEPPKRRGRPAKTAEPQEENISVTSMLEALPSDEEESVADLTDDTEPKRGKMANTESQTRTTGLGRGKSVPDSIHHATTDAPKRGRTKKAQADKADPVVEEPEVITVPKSRAGRAAKATEAESKAVDTKGTQPTETKKRGRAAAAQLQEELDDNVAESAKDAPKRRARVPKAEAEKSAASAAEDKPKRGRTAAAKKDTEVEAETADLPAPKTARGRKKAAPTTDAEIKAEDAKATGPKKRTARGAQTDEEPKKTDTKTTKATKATKGRSAKKDEVPPTTDAPSVPARKAGRPKKTKPSEVTEEAPPAAELPAAPAHRGPGRSKKQQPVEAAEGPPTEETAEPAESVKEKRQESKRVSIAPGPHPEAATPAKKTPAAPKRASTATIATPEASSSAAKSSGSGKRPAEVESAEPSSSPAAKRAKRTSTAETAPAEPPTTEESSTSRRKTLAGPVTPGGKPTTAQAPKTAPAVAKTRGRPRKSDASSGKASPGSTGATLKDDEAAGEAEVEEAPPSTKRAKATPRTSSAAKAPATPKAAPEATKPAKPPKTVQPTKTAKVSGTKRKRASSPGPARIPKRRNQGSPDVEIDASNRPSLAPATPKVTAALQAVINSRPKSGPAYWLMKAEPESRIEKGQDVKFSIDDLAAVTEPEPWSGVRNHSAKNNMLAMREGDLAFFYHSNCKNPGVAGICDIVGEAVPDETAFDKSHPYYHEQSKRENPTWYNVHVVFRQKFADPDRVSLKAIKEQEELKDMQLIKMSRLSVSMVKPKEWDFIMGLAGETLAEESVEKDWVVVGQEDVQAGAQEEEQLVEEAANAIADVIEGLAEAVAEQVGEAVAEEAGPEVAAEIADEVALEVAEVVSEQVAETMEEDAAVAGSNAGIRNRTSNIFPPTQIPISEDLSFLPDAPALAEADQLGDLPTTATSGRTKPSSRRASAGLTPAPKKQTKSASRGGSRTGSRARTLGPADLTAYDDASTTIPDAADVSLGEDLLAGFNGPATAAADDDDVDAAFLRTPSPERAAITGAVNDLRGADSSHGASVSFFGRVSAFLSPGRDVEGRKSRSPEKTVRAEEVTGGEDGKGGAGVMEGTRA